MNWTVKNIGAELRNKSRTAEEICRQSLKRVVESKGLNAFVTVTDRLAFEQAKTVDNRINNRKFKPLDGIPIAVKDNFCVRGVRTTCASRMLANFIPTYTACVVERLIDAGAILIGKTNLDEFGMGSGCVDSIHGHTTNAWNKDCIAGGSSGGSAVAVASGCVMAALGSDTGGSTRNPAAYNGIIGLKATYGRLSRLGLIPLVNSMDVPGILAKTVDDTVAVLNCVSGWDARDATSVESRPPVLLPENLSPKNLRIGIPVEYLTEDVSDEVVDAWKDVASLLSDAGAQVMEVSLPHTQHSIACYSVLNQCEIASNMARYDGLEFGLRGESEQSTEQLYAQSRALGLGEVVRRRILCGNYFLLAENYDRYFTKAMCIRRLISDDFDRLWASGIQVLLTPATLSDAPSLDDFLARDARAQSATQDYCTQSANMAGIPAVSVPITISSRRLPISLQLMAPMFDEQTLLATAKFIENIVDFHRHRVGEYHRSQSA